VWVSAWWVQEWAAVSGCVLVAALGKALRVVVLQVACLSALELLAVALGQMLVLWSVGGLEAALLGRQSVLALGSESMALEATMVEAWWAMASAVAWDTLSTVVVLLAPTTDGML
jgi:hypothetical protein